MKSKRSIVWGVLRSALTGFVLALAVIFATNAFIKPAAAEEEWECLRPPADCPIWSCSAHADGTHWCQYWSFSGPCSSGDQCTKKPIIE
jgi:hypothetical protein